MGKDKREVNCLRVSLSVHDFERVGGASGREGFRRTRPREEKYERPWRRGCAGSSVVTVTGGGVQGVESVWRAIVNSMLASPPVACQRFLM